MYRLLLFITTLLISLSGFAQTPSDSIQNVRKAQIEKARAAARAKAEARAAQRAKMEADRIGKSNNSEKAEEPKELQKGQTKKDQDVQKADEKNESKKESLKRERKRDKEKKAEKTESAKASAEAKEESKKAEKPKKPSIKERNMADTAVARSKYGDGTFGLRGNIGATIAWSDYSGRNKMGFDSWGFVLYGGMGYRINHIAYAGIIMDFEVIERIAISPMLDLVVAAPTPVAPFVELTAGPYLSYDENRNWVFQPRVGLSYRGKKNKIMRFGLGMRMYDDAFKSNSGSFKPQYAASYTVEF